MVLFQVGFYFYYVDARAPSDSLMVQVPIGEPQVSILLPLAHSSFLMALYHTFAISEDLNINCNVMLLYILQETNQGTKFSPRYSLLPLNSTILTYGSTIGFDLYP